MCEPKIPQPGRLGLGRRAHRRGRVDLGPEQRRGRPMPRAVHLGARAVAPWASGRPAVLLGGRTVASGGARGGPSRRHHICQQCYLDPQVGSRGIYGLAFRDTKIFEIVVACTSCHVVKGGLGRVS